MRFKNPGKTQTALAAHFQRIHLGTGLTKLLWAGIPAYAILKTMYFQSLIYLSYFLWFAIAGILFQLIEKKRLNQKYNLYFILEIWLSICGRMFLYESILYYDKFLHFFTPFLIACITYDFYAQTAVTKKTLTSFIIVSGLLLSFEFFDYILDFYSFFQFNTRGVYSGSGTMLMSPAQDTIFDLFIGLLAAVSAISMKRKTNTQAKNELMQVNSATSRLR
jgi:hypothetical protein